MKKEYIKPIIINIKICNDDLLVTASLYEFNKVDSVENIADEDGDKPISDDWGIIWND